VGPGGPPTEQAVQASMVITQEPPQNAAQRSALAASLISELANATSESSDRFSVVNIAPVSAGLADRRSASASAVGDHAVMAAPLRELRRLLTVDQDSKAASAETPRLQAPVPLEVTFQVLPPPPGSTATASPSAVLSNLTTQANNPSSTLRTGTVLSTLVPEQSFSLGSLRPVTVELCADNVWRAVGSCPGTRCVRVCICVRVRVCARVCVCVYVRMNVCAYMRPVLCVGTN